MPATAKRRQSKVGNLMDRIAAVTDDFKCPCSRMWYAKKTNCVCFEGFTLSEKQLNYMRTILMNLAFAGQKPFAPNPDQVIVDLIAHINNKPVRIFVVKARWSL